MLKEKALTNKVAKLCTLGTIMAARLYERLNTRPYPTVEMISIATFIL